MLKASWAFGTHIEGTSEGTYNEGQGAYQGHTQARHVQQADLVGLSDVERGIERRMALELTDLEHNRGYRGYTEGTSVCSRLTLLGSVMLNAGWSLSSRTLATFPGMDEEAWRESHLFITCRELGSTMGTPQEETGDVATFPGVDLVTACSFKVCTLTFCAATACSVTVTTHTTQGCYSMNYSVHCHKMCQEPFPRSYTM